MFSVIDSTSTDIDYNVNDFIKDDFKYYQPYPNPFNPVINIQYELNKDALLNITIYDMLGRQVKTLINGLQTSGNKIIQWNATIDQGQPVSAGVYLYIIEAVEFKQIKKIIFLK